MALNWKSLKPEYVRQACEAVAASNPPRRAVGIVVWHKDHPLPAKEVLRIAYRIANGLPDDAEVRFSSGDATLRLISELGFNVERLAATPMRRSDAAEENT